MLQEKGGRQEGKTEIEAFLDAIGVKKPVRISTAARNGHDTLTTWTGEGGVRDIDKIPSILAGRSGCLEIEEGPVRTTIFVRAVRKEEAASKPVDPRQLRMELKL